MGALGAGESLGSSYVLGGLLGRGASGTVFEVRRMADDLPMAAKVLHADLAEDPEVVARFVQERTQLVGLRVPGLVRVHDLVVDAGRAAISRHRG